MSAAAHCEREEVKTFWVNDRIWLCAKCFKLEKGKKYEAAKR